VALLHKLVEITYLLKALLGAHNELTMRDTVMRNTEAMNNDKDLIYKIWFIS
jgi:hypothetical protein